MSCGRFYHWLSLCNTRVTYLAFQATYRISHYDDLRLVVLFSVSRVPVLRIGRSMGNVTSTGNALRLGTIRRDSIRVPTARVHAYSTAFLSDSLVLDRNVLSFGGSRVDRCIGLGKRNAKQKDALRFSVYSFLIFNFTFTFTLYFVLSFSSFSSFSYGLYPRILYIRVCICTRLPASINSFPRVPRPSG